VNRNAHWFNCTTDLFVSCTVLYRFVPTVYLFWYVCTLCICVLVVVLIL
jgi:hypothetical protein